MDGPFVYNKVVTGKSCIGRQGEARIFANLLSQGENIVIFEPPKTGKKSLVQLALFNMKVSGQRFSTANVNLLNIRSVSDLLLRLGSALICSSVQSPEGYAGAVAEYLEGSHFTFDRRKYEDDGAILSLSAEMNSEDAKAVLRLPYKVAAHDGTKLYVIMEEFQNIMLTDDGDAFCRRMESVFEELSNEEKQAASYIFTGSCVNAMEDIFEIQRYFYHHVERVKLNEVDTVDIIEHVVKGFLATGKVIDRDLLLGVCKLFRNNIWYINHFASICDSLTKGYIMEPTLDEALNSMIAIHEPRFTAIMRDLTTFQVNLLRAILNGQTKFSSAEVIEQYGLNSSANVRRIKDALRKKEIVAFDGDGEPTLIDPLFEYWVRKYYFKLRFE